MILKEGLDDLLDVWILEARMSGVRFGSVTGGRPIMECIVSQPDSSVARDCSEEDGTRDSVEGIGATVESFPPSRGVSSFGSFLEASTGFRIEGSATTDVALAGFSSTLSLIGLAGS